MKRLFATICAVLAIFAASAQTAPVARYDHITLGDNEGFFDMNRKMGEIVKNLKDFTFSVYFRVDSLNHLDGYGHFIFACSALAENSADEGPYVACRLNEQRFEISTGGYMHEQFIMQGEKAKPGVWTHLLYRQHGHHGELYIDGSLIGTNEKMPFLSDIFKEAPSHCWIGKAPFKGDKYLSNTDIHGLSIYDYAVTDKQIEKFSKNKPE